MTSLLRVQANRLNAIKSTGPRTLAGKAKSSANALRHGLRRWEPALLPGESPAEWRKFAQAVLVDLNPLGPVQMMWAGRAAELMWRLRSAGQARRTLLDQQWREAAALAPRSAWWQHRQQAQSGTLPDSLEALSKQMTAGRREAALLARVAALPPGPCPQEAGPADAVTAADLMEAAAQHLRVGQLLTKTLQADRYPGIGEMIESPDVEDYRWTLGMVREGLVEVAGWANDTLEGLLATLVPGMAKSYRTLKARRRRAERELRQFRLCTAARAPETFQTFDRYEATLERRLTAVLSQLRAIQGQSPADAPQIGADLSQSVARVEVIRLETAGKHG